MAFTGRDIAKFATEVTGKNYVGLYDEAEEQDNMMKTEAQNKFKNLINRMSTVEKRNLKDVID